jgi:hypothetical protein
MTYSRSLLISYLLGVIELLTMGAHVIVCS